MSYQIKSDGKIYSSVMKHLGTVKSDGKIYSSAMKHLGTVKSDGKIYSPVNKNLGNVNNITKLFKNSSMIKPHLLVGAYHFIIKKIF